jgi:hypothetical protein
MYETGTTVSFVFKVTAGRVGTIYPGKERGRPSS